MALLRLARRPARPQELQDPRRRQRGICGARREDVAGHDRISPHHHPALRSSASRSRVGVSPARRQAQGAFVLSQLRTRHCHEPKREVTVANAITTDVAKAASGSQRWTRPMVRRTAQPAGAPSGWAGVPPCASHKSSVAGRFRVPFRPAGRGRIFDAYESPNLAVSRRSKASNMKTSAPAFVRAIPPGRPLARRNIVLPFRAILGEPAFTVERT